MFYRYYLLVFVFFIKMRKKGNDPFLEEGVKD